MKLYYVTCENDIGLNLEGYSGCYSSEENAMEAIRNADKNGYFNNGIEAMMEDGLLGIEEIEG